MNYYNENDPKAAAWLRELIRAGEIPAGDVDERSILEVRPHELAGYTQQHFFAGIGGWSLALRLAGWPDSRPVRTGSCPCQPFSQAGKQKAEKDERHLWPSFRDLITFGEPTTTFGEQVASPLGRGWLAGVRADLEALGYEVGAADLCAAGVGAPHIRQRLYWVAVPGCIKARRGTGSRETASGRSSGELAGCGEIGGLEHTTSDGRKQRRTESGGRSSVGGCGTGGLGNPNGARSQIRSKSERGSAVGHQGPTAGKTSPVGAWSRYQVAQCLDGKARRFEPGSFPLAHGFPHRVGLLRGYGNAIVPQLAAEFIQAAAEAI